MPLLRDSPLSDIKARLIDTAQADSPDSRRATNVNVAGGAEGAKAGCC